MLFRSGEPVKNDFSQLQRVWAEINAARLCRHSFVIAIGGGAVLDLVGFGAATAHRRIPLVRLPTTSLSQADGGLGVKNGVNYFGKKNWLGSFVVPHAVVNDLAFLDGLPPRDRRAGLIEALKVALVRDAARPPVPRKATKPTRASKRRRLDNKKRHGTLKSLRRSRPDD